MNSEIELLFNCSVRRVRVQRGDEGDGGQTRANRASEREALRV